MDWGEKGPSLVKKYSEAYSKAPDKISSVEFHTYLTKQLNYDITLAQCTSILKSAVDKTAQKTQKSQNADESQVEIAKSEPRFTYKDVGGLHRQKKELYDFVKHVCDQSHRKVYSELSSMKPVFGHLVHGHSGCGKTLFVEATVGQLREDGVPINFLRLSASEITNATKTPPIIETAISGSPSVLFIDDIDRMDSKSHPKLDEIFDAICADNEHDVCIVGATSDIDKLKDLRRTSRFSHETALGIPDPSSRAEILSVLFRTVRNEGVDINKAAEVADGFIGADLLSLVQESALLAVQRYINSGETDLSRAVVTQSDVDAALRVVQPSLRRDGFTTTSYVTFDGVGGLEDVKRELYTAIVDSIEYKDVFESYGQRAGSGLVMYGPPGCGKTLLARAVANEANRAAFISVKGPELLNKYLGSSEQAVRDVFQRARDSAPCIIFFDEIDAICPRRSDDSTNAAASRVVNQLLAELNGVVDRGQIFVIGATNRLELIDEAILRPQRLGKKIEVPKPDKLARADILRKILSKVKYRSEDINLDEIAEKSDDFSGAELDAVITEAIEATIKKTKQIAEKMGYKDCVNRLPKENRAMVDQDSLLVALSKIKKMKNL